MHPRVVLAGPREQVALHHEQQVCGLIDFYGGSGGSVGSLQDERMCHIDISQKAKTFLCEDARLHLARLHFLHRVVFPSTNCKY